MMSESKNNALRRVITFGTFDLLHEGHLRILRRARAEGDYLIVGVSSDQLNDRKGKRAIFSQEQRLSYIADLKYVDEVFFEESLELKDEYVKTYKADLLVMGDDWVGKFDWVSCEVKYLARTDGISSTMLKDEIRAFNRCKTALFGDTYLKKHMDCALAIVNQLTNRNVAPIFTNENTLPRNLKSDTLIYFNKPINSPHREYAECPRILIDHGASHLKWFLGSKSRFDFFDIILTAGPDHVRSLRSLFDKNPSLHKARAAGFIKSSDILPTPKMTREEICQFANLDPGKPIVLFVPTWHITANEDIIMAIQEVAKIPNHVASFHPETAHLPLEGINIVKNTYGITTELMKHCDVVISDLSSTIFEAAALKKPVIQILLKEYPDNTAVLYDFSLSAGTAEHFCGGFPCRPRDVLAALEMINDKKQSISLMNSDCANRILAGTYISNEATEMIADQIERICEQPRVLDADTSSEMDTSTSTTTLYNRNLFFARNRLIAHGGGNYLGHHASNSVEAMEAALKVVNVVELDFCMGKDGIIVAHDNFEERYGIGIPFSQVSLSMFHDSQYESALTPVTAVNAITRCTKSGTSLVCDLKASGDEYKDLARQLYDMITRHGHIEQAVIQCYCVEDFVEALRLGFQRAILPVWKFYYRDPLGSDVFDFFKTCININADVVWGLSLPYVNKHMALPIIEYSQFLRLYAFWKRIFVHGAPFYDYSRILKMNVGLFADGVDRELEFRHIPPGFDWRRYLFLNRDLLLADRDCEVEAMAHFVKFGQAEGRFIDYDLPESFNYSEYINRNPKLRKSNINSFDSAAAHYTRYGSKEGLFY